jgi:formylmethanofuran dehydrogenase subunit B
MSSSLEFELTMRGSDPSEPKTSDDMRPPETTIIEPVTCLVCGCLCDDIAVVKDGDRMIEARNACAMGREWFLRDRSEELRHPVARINDEPAEAEEAAKHAAELMARAKAPIILGLTASTCETVAAAIELADRIGALIEPGTARVSLPRILAYQRAGRVSATLGEVKNRADVVVFWGADPVVTHPRHWQRYSVEPRGRFVPEGRSGRTVIVIDQQRTATADQAEFFFEIDEDRQFEVLWVLRALVRGVEVDAERVRQSSGCELERLRDLASRLMEARYGAFFHGPLLSRGTLTEAATTIEAATGLVRDLNQNARFITLGMGQPGNAHGVEAVLSWQTGFPASVDLAAGYPRSLPVLTSAIERLSRWGTDLAVIVGGIEIDDFPPSARKQLRKIPVIVVAPPDRIVPDRAASAVSMFAATPGLDEEGIVMRVDGVSLPVISIRPTSLPTERQWLEAICQQLTSLAGI